MGNKTHSQRVRLNEVIRHNLPFCSSTDLKKCITNINNQSDNNSETLIEGILNLYIKDADNLHYTKSKQITLNNVLELVSFYNKGLFADIYRNSVEPKTMRTDKIKSKMRWLFPFDVNAQIPLTNDGEDIIGKDKELLEIFYSNFMYISPFRKNNKEIALILTAIISYLRHKTYYYPSDI